MDGMEYSEVSKLRIPSLIFGAITGFDDAEIHCLMIRIAGLIVRNSN